MTHRPGAPAAADRLIQALSLPLLAPAAGRAPRPLPLTELPPLPRDGSVLYGIARVDASGRVASRELVAALGWNPGDRLDLTVIAAAILIRAAAGGLLAVPRKPGIVLPAAARHRCAISTGDHVLLAAAPRYGIVIVHTMSALDDMLARHHATALPGPAQ